MVPTGLGLDLSLRCSNLELNHNTTTLLDSPEKGESFVGFENYRKAYEYEDFDTDIA